MAENTSGGQTWRRARARRRDARSSLITCRSFPPMIADESAGGGGGQDAGPTPLEYIAIGLAACINVSTARMAEKIRFNYSDIQIDTAGMIDTRGRLALADVPVGWTSARVEVQIVTEESPERLAKLADLVARYCPVDAMMRASVPDYQVNWRAVTAIEE